MLLAGNIFMIAISTLKAKQLSFENDSAEQEKLDKEYAQQLQDQFEQDVIRINKGSDVQNQDHSNDDWDIEYNEDFLSGKNSTDVIQCPICGNIFESNDIENHVNQCIDQNGNNPKNSPQHAMVVEKYDPVNKEDFDCPICFDSIAPGSGYIFQECQHQYCGECLGSYYQVLIMSNKVIDIKCPNPNCEHLCTHGEIRFLLPEHLFNKFLDFSKIALINKDPEMRWCPTPNCGNAVKRKKKGSSKMECSACNFQFCFECGDSYHEDVTCEQHQKMLDIEKKTDPRFKIWQMHHSKPCPNCKAPIQKNGGCNHMYCEKCKHEFCWVCLKQYTSDHFSKGWCSQFGTVPGLYFVKRVGRAVISKILEIDSNSTESEQDQENIFEKNRILRCRH